MGALTLSGATLTLGSSAGAAKKLPTYEIGFQGVLSGGAASLGIPEKNGTTVAVDLWNANKHRKFNIKMIPGDDQCDPTVAPSVATQLSTNKKVLAIVGPSCSGATLASLPIYGPTGMAVLSPSATNPPLTTNADDPYHIYFRDVANDSIQGPADANYLAKTLKKKTIEVVNDASTYGAGLATAVATQAKTDGATVTTATLPSTTACGNGGTGTNDQITIPSGVTAVFYGGYYCDFAQMTDVVRTAGYKGVLMSGDGSDEPAYITDLSKVSDGSGVYLTCACSTVGSTSAAGKAFNTEYRKLFKTAPGSYAAESYDGANMIFTAMTKIKKVTRKAITAELKKLTYRGITKVIKFLPTGDVTSKAIYVSKVVVKSGKGTIKQIASTKP
ncbi:MAG TPA: branched-chain amino acid ABC transporter substrate-binding protein [Acidimicrobiales bacterium]|nr:branched-chain amino acid ABC transporter substrate-binding protein [Acidimicrobiales bacterium]